MKKKNSVGCLFWIALALLVVVAFLYNRDRINQVLVSTGLFSAKAKPAQNAPPEKPPQQTRRPPAPRPAPTKPAPSPAPAPSPSLPSTAPATGDKPAQQPSARPDVVIRVPAPSQTPADQSTPPGARVRRARIFFVEVSPSGEIAVRGVMRSVPDTDSPLTEALTALLDGQAAQELSGGLLTMIPKGVKLRGAHVRDGTATVDLSDEFRFNALGHTGLVAQVKQLVYTATEFTSVKTVQILIEGKKLDYLSSEGPHIGTPISRDQLIKGSP
jgi:germination protein M